MKSLFALLLSIVSFQAYAQYQLTGRVTDAASGMAIKGANISLTNGLTKATADSAGYFSIILSVLPDTLIITHVGYKIGKRVITSVLNPVKVSLDISNGLLEEVIVSTGYQSIPKERATGSFVSISGDLLTQQVQTNVLDGLPYVANSVSTGQRTNQSAPQLRVRGMSTLNGPQDPLIILDNFPYEGDIGNINPNDVESITILKDAAAASIWGARAGNGVIVITTKKAKYNQPLQVNVNTNLKVLPIPDLYHHPQITTADVIELEQLLFDKGYRFADTANMNHPPFSGVYELLFQRRNGLLSENALQNELDKLKRIDVRKEYTDLFYRRGINQQHSITLRDGTQNHLWNAAVGYDRNKDVLDALYQRLTMRYGNTINLTDRFTLSTSINFAWRNQKSGKPSFESIRQNSVGLPPYTTFLDADGQPIPFFKDYRQSYISEMSKHEKLLDWNYYPTDDYRHDRTSNNVLSTQVDAGLHYRLLPGFDVQVNYQLQFQQSDLLHDQSLESYAARDLINRFYQPDDDIYGVPVGAIQERSENRILTHNYRGQLNLDQSWGRHQVTAIAGTEIRSIERKSANHRYYGYDDNLLLTSRVNYLTQYDNFVNTWPQTVPAPASFGAGINRYISFYATGSYTFDRRYVASLSARRDASNIFGANTNNKWAPLWSAGLAWSLHEESFYSLTTLPYLKLRATYGFSGNIDPSLSAITTMAYRGTSIYTLERYASVDRFYNPDLRWEKIGQFNLGLDFKLANGLLTGSLEVYLKKGVDLYGPSPIDYTSGIGVPVITKNAANMKARGIDVHLTSINTDGAIRWSTTLNTSFYRDRVTAYYLNDIPLTSYVGSSMIGQVDMPVQAIRSFRWAGLEPNTGNPMGFGPDGEPSTDYNYLTDGASVESLRFHGSAAPSCHGAIGNTLQWKNLSFSCYIGYRLGHYFRRPSFSLSAFTNGLKGHSDYHDRWQKPGDEHLTNVPSVSFPSDARRQNFYRGSEILVERADNIRLQYINIAYRYRCAQVFLNCNNLGVIWMANDHGLDPDYVTTAIPPGMDVALGLRLSL